MLSTVPPRFIFRGNAMPFGGRITKKDEKAFFESIPGPPTAALAVVGGFSRATSGAAKPHEAFSWGATIAEAKGEQLPNNHYQTTVTSSISQVSARNKPHVFEVDVLRVTLVSDHMNLKPASIEVREAVFGSKMQLDGEAIEVGYDLDLNKTPTLESFLDRYQSNKEFYSRHQNDLIPERVSFGDPPKLQGGYVYTSIAHTVRYKGRSYPGNSLKVEGFGTLYFGEVLINDNNRRVTMVRLRMGSDLGAEVAYAESDPNGTWGN